MDITEKMIRELQSRVDVSYEEAERFLRRADGDVDKAEKHARKKANSFWNRLFNEIENIINATLVYRIRVYKDEDQFLNIPIIGFLIVLVLIGVDKTLLLGVVFVILALMTDCSLQIKKVDREREFSFYRTVEKNGSRRNRRKGAMNPETGGEAESSLGPKVEEEPPAAEPNRTSGEEEVNSSDAGPSETPDAQEGTYIHEDEDDDYYEVTIDK